MRKPLFGLAVLAIVASGAFASVATVQGADHGDGPLNMANPTADIADIYAFRSAANANNVVLALDFNGLIPPSDNMTRGVFDSGVQFQLHVDRNADLLDDATVTIRATNNPQQIIIEGLGAPITAPITPPNAAAPIITDTGGVKVFAGLRDDPFFFNVVAFRAFVANPQLPAKGLRPASMGDPSDTFAGTNVLAVVMELPATVLTGAKDANSGTVKVWASSTKGGSRIDRMAIPAINTALIPADKKDAFNMGDPVNDKANFRPTGIATINGLRAAVDKLFGNSSASLGGPLGNLTADEVGAALIPDVVTIDFSKPLAFPNGRRLTDDVVDTALGVVLNRGGAAGISDGISGNDKPLLTTFPYEAAPNGGGTPATIVTAPSAGGAAVSGGAPAAGASASIPSIAPPNTGDGGLMSQGTMWTLSALFFVVALGFGGAGTFVAIRRRG